LNQRKNEFGQLIGDEVSGWNGAALPSRQPIDGRYCVVEALDVSRHARDLFEAFSDDKEGTLWTYMATGPFATIEDFIAWMEPACKTNDPLFYALIDLSTGRAAGMASYMRIKQIAGVIEVGSISFSPRMQRTRMATEAMFLMMRRAFDELGFRRYEWKCDSLNEASRLAAERLGFSFEGVFRQAVIYKGRNRDTAWYSIIDSDWPVIKKAFEMWLDPDNFDEGGCQKGSLRDMITLQ